jgi:adenosylcobinamide-GDP ribazoletransferase
MKHLRLALGFLTILPVRLQESPQPGDMGRAAAWFPWVGLLIGCIVWAAKWGLDQVFPALVSAGLCVALWAVLTGGLHLDGLADCCDGLLNASSPARRLEIMKDPRLGSFGGAGLVLQLLLKTLALASLSAVPAVCGVLLAPTLARWLILLAGRQPSARPGGMGADFALGLRTRSFFLAALLPIVLILLGGWRALLAAILAHLAAWGIFRLAQNRLGGLTGDVFGLTVEVAELVVLLAFVLKLPGLA